MLGFSPWFGPAALLMLCVVEEAVSGKAAEVIEEVEEVQEVEELVEVEQVEELEELTGSL